MLRYVFNKKLDDNANGDEPFMLCAEDQAWDEATLKQLREEHNVIFMTSGDGVMPVLVLHKDSDNPLFVLGSEDDGTIQFERRYNHFCNTFSAYWAKSLIADLEEAVRFCNYIPFTERGK